jgi:Diacylglycerol kinase accessory domain
VNGQPLLLNESIEGLVVLNISKYSAGKDLWNTKKTSEPNYRTPSLDDGLFEVVGFLGMVHLAKIQTGISNGVRLGQGRTLEIRVLTELAAQVDGEPFTVPPATVRLGFENQATLLSARRPK